MMADLDLNHCALNTIQRDYPICAPEDVAQVQGDNQAADFVLDEIHALVQRGGATVRENAGRSLH